MNYLKITCLLCWAGLLLAQLSLILLDIKIEILWVSLLVFPLLIPAPGLFRDKRYTYKWVGFLTLLYFCIGISELVVNPELKLYGYATTVFSTLLFLSSIYYARFLNLQQPDK